MFVISNSEGDCLNPCRWLGGELDTPIGTEFCIAIDELAFTVSGLAGPPSTVLEPATLALMATGLTMLGYVARRRRV